MKKGLVLLAAIYLSGCATMGVQTVPNHSVQSFHNAAVLIKEKKYGEASAVYKKIAAEAPGSELAAEAVFESALVLTFQDNPHNDHIQAITEFESFLKHYPDNKRSREAQSWISVLKSILELKKENEHLNKNIDQLKRLDIRHEERRGK